MAQIECWYIGGLGTSAGGEAGRDSAAAHCPRVKAGVKLGHWAVQESTIWPAE